MGKQRVIVNVSDAKASSNPSDVLITYSLGSCIAVCLYDQSAQIGGMLHYQLPDSKMDVDRAKKRPFMFADTGVKILIDQLVRLGANKKRMQVKIAGGAAIANGPVGFDIGKRNQLAIKKIMWKNGLFIDSAEVGGFSPRNMYLSIDNGYVTVKSNGVEKNL